MEAAGWTERFERHLGWIAIPHITRGLVVLNAVTYILDAYSRAKGAEFYGKLYLDPQAVMDGEVWRLFTFIFNSGGNSFFFLFFLWFTWFVGDVLEEMWGSFRLTLYLLIGMLGIVAGAFIFGVALPNFMLYSSMLFAFGTAFPKYELCLFPLPFPIQARWIALFTLVVDLILLSPFLFGLTILIFIFLYANYILFFAPSFLSEWRLQKAAEKRRKKFRGEE